MTPYVPPIEDFNFLLYDVFNVDHDWTDESVPIDRELANSILAECGRVARDVMAPLSSSADQEGAKWQDGVVSAPQGFKEAFAVLTQGGWLGTAGNPEFGGQGMPKVLTTAVEEMFWGANTNLWLYAALTSGATYCIDAHASHELKSSFLPAMYDGRWTGAMALTESHAGTDLGMLRTKAEHVEGNTYAITGTKIFITSGEHDLAENIIHLVLARIEGAPQGTRGISLFLVPKYLVNAQGELGERNGFASGAIEHKMGIRGSATSVINYDGAMGYLIGEPNAGLRCMFTMMNYARVSVGVQGLGLSERAYQMASSYAKERLQGRAPNGPVNEQGAADPIIEHPDVRRMLLTQRALTEGSRAFALFAAVQLDRTQHADSEIAAAAMRYVELLTPIVKAFISDRAMEATLLAQQCFGGHGYIVESEIEQIVRDARISQIYEGTNGIQALDLLGRKVLQDGGKTLAELVAELRQEELDPTYSEQVSAALDLWIDVTEWLGVNTRADPSLAGTSAVDYLNLAGYVLYAWLWARMSSIDDGTLGKSDLARFYFDQLLPRVEYHATVIKNGSDAVTGPKSHWF
ncbi:MAG: acyl-CoA dehydrogenase [Gammaproteobacteria bacterium]|nr:acyl-CoA dehydrogenase [Gammaproteobacteria bacterium]